MKIFTLLISLLLFISCDQAEPLEKIESLEKVEPQSQAKISSEEVNRKMPEFSWETLPLYMHVRKATAFNEQELKYLSQFPLICLEKTMGMKTYGSSEEGSIQAAKAIKELNPKSKVLYYRNVLVHYPFYKSDRQLKKVKDAFLQNKQGQGKLVRNTQEAYDLTNLNLRKWWVNNAKTVLMDPAIDGLFLDGNIKALEEQYLLREIGSEKKQETIEAYQLLMKETQQALSEDKLMIANMIRARFQDSGLEYMKYFDGSYLENFEKPVKGLSREDYMVKGIEATQRAAKDGKIIAMTLGLGESAGSHMGIDDTRKDLKSLDKAQSRLEYCIGLFLICAEKYSYLNIHDGYDVNTKADGSCHSKLWLKAFPEYEKALGKPLQDAVKKGYVYTRKFEHLDVKVDLRSQKAELKWH
ncbi:putative glycoside hydrolase [Lentisphaera marina]|uniref:putative glycoside hydrolase n=1 Tax=Lentisphaera marina TaxID=1111041 RepID=UPI0023673205|nr:putative glycoside hydrolase [Lentisphaera marina]MDD7983870.1 putative glycoside hydrolase [Lentisphaera marina]